MSGAEPSARAYDRTSHILVVDDDSTILKFFKIHLNKFFSKVIVVKNGSEAMIAMKEREIDLVICDIMMPRVNGIQLLKKMRRFDFTIPVLFITGAELASDIEADIGQADGILRKPFGIDQLHQFIEEGMQKRDSFKELNELIKDKDILKKILKSKKGLENFVSPKDMTKVKKLIKNLNTAA